MAVDFLTEAFKSLRSRRRFSSLGVGKVSLQGRRSPSSEDALQDAFCKLWGRKFSSEMHAEAMLAKTAKNITIDEYRKISRTRVESLEGRQVAAEDCDPMEKEALFRKVEASIDEMLSPLQSKIIRMHEYEGTTFKGIASRLGMQPAAVRMQISRARKLIREKYKNEYEGL